MQRKHYDEDHLAFGDAVRTFIAKEIAARLPGVGSGGHRPARAVPGAGANGFLGMQVPEQYGGGGTDDFRFNQVLAEELSGRRGRRGAGHHAAQRHLPAVLPAATAPTSRSSAGCPASPPAS